MILYVEHTCPVCVETEAELESASFYYEKNFVTASNEPGYLFVWQGDKPTKIRREIIPSVPALYDKDQNYLICGKEGILEYLNI